MFTYFFALIPLYVLVYRPLQNHWQPKAPGSEAAVGAINSSLVATDEPLYCAPQSYHTHILSQEPLIIYIESFLSPNESAHLTKVSEPKWEASTISNGATTYQDAAIRSSEVALLDRDDTVRCIEHRARAFQGWRPDIHIELLRTQKYVQGGEYKHHFDWVGGRRGVDRVSTFMVYVDAKCSGGGTQFPRVRMPSSRKGRWCHFLECGEAHERLGEMGVEFKPIKGNAVFWVNMRSDGKGYEETYHAGLPVTEGFKIGLNIWSWGSNRVG